METEPVFNLKSAVSSPPAGYRFPREVIAVAVRWYLRYGLSYRRAAGRAWHRGRPRDGLPLGADLHLGVYRRRPTCSPLRGWSLVRRRDLRQDRRTLDLPVPGG